jgi:hypothetical protein
MRNLRVYLDDERPAPEGWLRIHWPSEAIALLHIRSIERLAAPR